MPNSDLTEDLERFVEECKARYENFPDAACTNVAIDMFDKFGFLYVTGTYLGDVDQAHIDRMEQKHGKASYIPMRVHDMSFDPERQLFMDLTMFQFDASLPEILLMNQDDPRIVRNGVTQSPEKLYKPEGIWTFMGDETRRINIPAAEIFLPEHLKDSAPLSRATRMFYGTNY